MNPDDVPELEDVEIPRQTFDFQDHDWHQEGYTLICSSCPSVSRHGTNIQPGYMLTGNKGSWEVVPEGAMKQ